MTAFRRILVAVDFWRASAEAVDKGRATLAGEERYELPPSTRQSLELANALLAADGTLRLYHVAPSLAYTAAYAGPESPWLPGPTVREIDEQTRRHAEKVLHELAHRLLPDARFEVGAACGHTVERLLAEAERFGADAIVLGTSGRSRAGRFFLGSTADKIIRQAPCPVIIVPTTAIE